MSVPICEYIKTGGKKCGSPALRGFKNCYYHEQLRQAMPTTTMFVQENRNVAPGEMPVTGFQMPFLDDGAAIQIGFMQLIHGVSYFRLNPRQAKLILSALHGASANLRQMDKAIASAAKPIQAAIERGRRASGKVAKKGPTSATVRENKERGTA